MKRLLIGDFNTETSESRIDSFIYEHDLQNLVKEKTCFKSVENPSCIDLILTNNAMAFQNTTTVFTGLSDFHKLVLTVLKTSITKSKPLLKTGNFPDNLRLADITPVFKKKNTLHKVNYRPVSSFTQHFKSL